MPDDPKPLVILGPDGQPATPEQPVRLKLTDREPLADIQERLRRETAERAQGGRRKGRQV